VWKLSRWDFFFFSVDYNFSVTESRMASSSSASSSALFFKFDLNQSCLHFVNEVNLTVLEKLLENSKIVLIGIDTETKPNRKRNGFNPVSIIQMAFRTDTGYEHVIIADLLALGKNAACLRRFDELLAPLFANAAIYKLGQALIGDFKLLAKSYPSVSAFRTCNAILDTNVFMKKLFPEPKREYSLKTITNHFLHFDLDKAQQMSDWGRRPLTVKQVHYAACDALVLLRLYDVMTYFHVERLKGHHMDEYSMAVVGTEGRSSQQTPKFEVKSILLKYCCEAVNTVQSKDNSNGKTIDTTVPLAGKRKIDEVVVKFETKDDNCDFEISAICGGKFLQLPQKRPVVTIKKPALPVATAAVTAAVAVRVVVPVEPVEPVKMKVMGAVADAMVESSTAAGDDELGTDNESLTCSTDESDLSLTRLSSPTPSSASNSVSADAYIECYRPLKRRVWSPIHKQQHLSL
jgi:hypothetical protein